MKNQYVGDIGDYGKYGLLRFLANRGVKIGVNWYLTKNDLTNDGNKTDYLKDDKEKCYDPDLYEILKQVAGDKNKKVTWLEERDIIPNAIYYNYILDFKGKNPQERKAERLAWNKNACNKLKNVDLVFADPDNGSTDDEKSTRINGEKYVALGELEKYYCEGKDVVYYCHKARRKQADWETKMRETESFGAKVIVLTFHRGTQRSYIFGVHPENFDKYDMLIKEFENSKWGTVKIGNKKAPFSREI